MRRTWFGLVLPCLALATLNAGTISAVPDCGSSGTLADLISFGASGCEINGLRYFGFSWTQVGGTINLAANQVDFSALGSGTASVLGFTSNGFSVTGNQSLLYALSYNEDPPPPIIRRLDQQLNDPVTFPGFAKVTTTACVGSSSDIHACTGPMDTLLTYDDGNGNSQLNASAEFGPVGTLGIITRIDLAANGASASITGFTDTTNVIPEPSSYLLVACGLAALAAQRRKPAKLVSNSLRSSD